MIGIIKLNERTSDPVEIFKRFRDSVGIDLRVAAPGIIQSVDYNRQTCTVQLAIREKLNFDGNLEWVEIPALPDVPFFIYSGGGYCLTLPIKPGDDCLVVFSDNCMDAWWQSGGVQNQIERRRHDLSDGFAIVGFRSQPQVVAGYSPNTLQLRNATGDACIEITGSNINIKADTLTINANTIVNGTTTLNANLAVNSTANIASSTTIEGRSFVGHTHSGVQSGGGSTGGVN